MASHIGKTPLRALSARTVAALAKPESGAPLSVATLPNGVTVASSDDGGPLTSLCVLVKAGSRYEAYDDLGATHVLRAALGLSSKSYTGFGIARNVQQAGSSISVSGGRDYIAYGSQFLRGTAGAVMERVVDAIANPHFKKWEMPDAHRKVAFQVAEMEPHARAVELLHKAAFRDGLGNSVFCPEHMVGKHRPRDLKAYHEKVFTGDRTVVVGSGIDHSLLVDVAQLLDTRKGSGLGTPAAKVYGGGDERWPVKGSTAHIAVAAAGALADAKEKMAFYCLQKILGDGPMLKYGCMSGKLARKLPSGGEHSVSGLYMEYEGASLVGFFLSSEAATAGQNLAKAVTTMRNLEVTEADLKAAKNQIKVELSELCFSARDQCETMASQYFLTKEFRFLEEYAGMADQVALADVKAAAKKLSTAKLSLGASGNLGSVPYIDSL